MFSNFFRAPVAIVCAARRALPGLLCLIFALLVLAGCGTLDVAVEPAVQATATAETVTIPTATQAPGTPEATQTAVPTVPPTATVPAAAPTATALPFEAAVYRNAAYGFEFNYPAGWNIADMGVIGSRASVDPVSRWRDHRHADDALSMGSAE